MAKNRTAPEEYSRPLRRLLVWLAVLVLLAFFILRWCIDSPRVERFRAALIDAVVPNSTGRWRRSRRSRG